MTRDPSQTTVNVKIATSHYEIKKNQEYNGT